MMRGTGEEGAKASVVLVDERAAAARAHRKRHEADTDTVGLVMIDDSIFLVQLGCVPGYILSTVKWWLELTPD